MSFEFSASFEYNGKKQYVLPGENDVEGVKISLDCRKVGDSGIFGLLKLKNESSGPSGRFTRVKTLDVDIIAESMFHCGLRGDSCGSESFMPLNFALTKPYHEEPAGGRSSNTTGFPYFTLVTPKNAFVLGIGWTGQWSKDILPVPGGFNLQIGLCDSDFYLEPGEEVRLPSVLIVAGENAGAVEAEFRRQMRLNFSPYTRLGEKFAMPIAIQVFDRQYNTGPVGDRYRDFDTVAGQKRIVDTVAPLGVFDTLWIDAAWFPGRFPEGVGNIAVKDSFGGSLKPVSDYAHENGLKFLVWFEPERAHRGTENFSHENHTLTVSWDENNRLYDLGNPEARKWLTDRVKTLIRENGIDLYRQDFNMDPLDYWREADVDGRKGIHEMKYIAGLYQMWDDILAEFPELWIDNCASGGRRLDLEMSCRSVTLWRSDTGCFPESEEQRTTVWSQNQILGIGKYIPYHDCASWEPRAYDVRSTAAHGLACNFDIYNPDFDFEMAKKSLAEVKSMSKFWDGDFYPLTKADLREDIWAAYQLNLGDSGAVYAFRREACNLEIQIFALNGIDKSKTYAVTVIDENFEEIRFECSGEVLGGGFELKIPNPRSSAIVLYKAM